MSLDKKRKQLEIDRVTMAKKEIEFKVDEYYHEIERLKGNLKIQNDAIERLNKEINKDVKNE